MLFESKKTNAISNFNLELTRKCNMKCDFCHRGKAQNLEITQDIIDKTFEELKDTLLLSIQFSGGEPTLALKMFDYAAERIIRNKIKIANVGIFTNGILLNPDFLSSIKKLFSYIKSNHVNFTLLNRFNSKYSAKKCL